MVWNSNCDHFTYISFKKYLGSKDLKTSCILGHPTVQVTLLVGAVLIFPWNQFHEKISLNWFHGKMYISDNILLTTSIIFFSNYTCMFSFVCGATDKFRFVVTCSRLGYWLKSSRSGWLSESTPVLSLGLRGNVFLNQRHGSLANLDAPCNLRCFSLFIEFFLKSNKNMRDNMLKNNT